MQLRRTAMILWLALLAAAGCGREAPESPADPGGGGLPDTRLLVDSSPQGAAILLDGADTGEVTPFTFTGLDVGEHTVALDLPGYLVSPASTTVTLAEGEPAEVPASAFATRSRRTVVLEGFANIDCAPCPQLTDNLLTMSGRPDLGPDRVVFAEYAVFFPNFADPFNLHNPDEIEERRATYAVTAAPALVLDGAPLASPLDYEAMLAEVIAALADDPGVLIDVTADVDGTALAATIAVTALRAVDLAGHSLFVGVFQDEIVWEPAPGSNGQTEFHHVFLDRADDLPALGPLAADQTVAFDLDLVREAAWGVDATTVYAFIQHDDDRSVLQGGSNALTAAAPASLFTGAGAAPARRQEGPRP